MKIVVTRMIPEAGLAFMRDAGLTVEVLPRDRPCTREELLAAAEGAAGIVTMLTDQIDHEFLQLRPCVRAIANFAVGYNNIDVAACSARGVKVSNTPDVLTDATAEIAWTLMFMAARRAGEGERMVRARQWPGWGPMQLLGQGILGKTLGIIGAGRIGQRVAEMSRGFRMKVIYHHRRISAQMESLGATLEPLANVLRQSDFVSLHVPLTGETRHLIGERELAMMKKSAVLINTSRGPVVDEAALAEALKKKRIFAAGLDVFEEEPKIYSALYGLENVVMLPHIGSGTVETRGKMSLLVGENMVEMVNGRRGVTQVN